MKNEKRIPFVKAFFLLIAVGLFSHAAVFASDGDDFKKDTIIPLKSSKSFIELYKLKQKGVLNTIKDDGNFVTFETRQPQSLIRVEKRSWDIFMLGAGTELAARGTADKKVLGKNVEYKDFPVLYNKLNTDKDFKPTSNQETNSICFQYKSDAYTVNLQDWDVYSKGLFAKDGRYHGSVKY